jgi:Na+-translocating ferredoxin:NAD+ oxidoreductase subunit E
MRGEKLKNPVFLLLVGLCPVAAVTDRVSTAFSMAVCAFLVLFLTSLTVSALRGRIRERSRRTATVVIAGFWVALLDWLLGRFLPEVRSPLGIYLPLLAVSCLLLTHGSRFAAANPVGPSLSRGMRLWAGFALALLLMSLVREPLGHGTVTLFELGPLAGSLRIGFLSDHPLRIFAAPAGALLVLGYGAALFSLLQERRQEPNPDVRDGREDTP